MMIDLFADSQNPFYKFGDLIFLQKIASEDWVKFIIERFEETGKYISEEVAFKIADLFSTEAPALVTEIEKEELINNGVDMETGKSVTECIKAVNYPRMAETHDSPSLVRNVMLSAIVSAIVVYAIYFVIALLDNTIKSEDEIKEYFGDYPLLASIPNWTNK
jgi:capsular polysaccharide biosynthesis protein